MQIVSADQWRAARLALLEKEKAFTRASDALSAARRALPWEKVATDYVFEGARGSVTLADLFRGRSQLIVYHFMFGPDWDAGCKSCSFWADNFDPTVVHLRARDTNLVAISRAPYQRLAAYRERMGWSFEWVSVAGNSFNRDFAVSFRRARDARQQLQFRHAAFRRRGGARHQRVRARGWRALSYLFDLCARSRYAQRRLSPARPRAQGTRRGRPELHHGMGAPPRRIRKT